MELNLTWQSTSSTGWAIDVAIVTEQDNHQGPFRPDEWSVTAVLTHPDGTTMDGEWTSMAQTTASYLYLIGVEDYIVVLSTHAPTPGADQTLMSGVLARQGEAGSFAVWPTTPLQLP